MLILTRRPGEIIRVGRDITITVMGHDGNKIRIGVQAPREVVIDREEVHQRKQQETCSAQDAVAAPPRTED